MELTLQPEEATLLARILANYLADLRMEIGATDSFEWRQSLKRDEETVKALLARLPAPEAEPVPAGAAPGGNAPPG